MFNKSDKYRQRNLTSEKICLQEVSKCIRKIYFVPIEEEFQSYSLAIA